MSTKEIKFPIEFFPDSLVPIIQEVAYCYNFDTDYLCASILSTCATAIGNSHAIRVKDQWIERSTLWVTIVGLPGVSKSHPMSWAMKPLHDREKIIYKEYKEKLKEYNQDPDKDNKPKPELIKTVIGDATPEAIAHQLSINERGILIHNDELSGFLGTFQRYNKGNDEQFYLTVWSGKPWVVDRKSSFPIRLNEPVVNINGTIQPDVLEKLFKDKEDSGFTDRWLLCYPKNVKKEYWKDDEISYGTEDKYKQIINDLSDMSMAIDEWDNITSHIIEYEPAAWQHILKWHKSNTDKINSSEINMIRAVRAKMEIYIHRFALIAYLLEVVTCESIPYKVTETAAIKACSLADYFLEQIISLRKNEPAERLESPWKDLYDMLPDDEREFEVMHYMQLAKMMGINEGSAKAFLSRNVGKLFTKAKRGYYYKN